MQVVDHPYPPTFPPAAALRDKTNKTFLVLAFPRDPFLQYMYQVFIIGPSNTHQPHAKPSHSTPSS